MSDEDGDRAMTRTEDANEPTVDKATAGESTVGTSAVHEPTREMPEYASGRAGLGAGRSTTESGVGWPEEAEEMGRPLDAGRSAGASREELAGDGSGRRGRGLLVLAGVIVVVLALCLYGTRSIGLWPDLSNPFDKQKTDRSQPALLKSIQDLSRFTAAQGNFEQVVDLKEDRKYIPDFLVNHRTLFIAVGTVDAYVDFSQISQGAVVQSADAKSVEIKLPAPQLTEPNLDLDKSYVFAEQRGLWNRVGDAFGGDANRQQETYKLAKEKIATAAKDTELAQRAQDNTRKMLEGLLRSLGYQTVTITFPAS
jgi:hypothetical protein